MQKPPLHYFTIGQLSSLYQKGTISPSDITRLELERIHSQDGELNAFATLMEQSAMESAEILGNELSRGKIRGPLHGVPIGLKDLIYTMGIQTMGGTKVMENHIPSFDATLVTRLKDAGAIVLGKLNLTEGAMRGYNTSRQVPKNPWNPQRWSGASSSGSGVAVSSGLCFGALGSDTGGSIRFPSASCGIVGLKPTYGAISRHGVIPLAESLDHVGPMTRSVLDAVYMFNAMIGRDSKDATTFHRPAIDVSAVGNNQLKGFNIGYSESYAEQGVDPTIISMIRKSILKIESLGANIESLNFPEIDTYLPAWRVICSAEAFRAHSEYFPSQREDYGPWFAEWLEMGEAVTSGDYIEANNVRIHCNTLFSSIFEQIDAMICPTTTTFPEPVDDQIHYGPMDPSTLQPAGKAPHQRFTVPFDYNGYPTICLPCGFNEEGLPGSLQIVGKPGSEETICRIAHAYESNSNWKDINPIP
jgi:amidase